jgi:enamine deaminase RidA (YjgF/YER057c/UK114 family)
MLSKRTINAPDAPQAVGCYAQAMEIAGFSHILHVSGQIPVV